MKSYDKIDYTVLIDIMEKVLESINDFSFCDEYKKEYKKKLQDYLVLLHKRDKDIIDTLKILFAPTGEFQDMFLDEGCGDAYLQIATQFDRAVG